MKRDLAAGIIAISHRAYIDTIAARFNLEDAKPASTPLPPGYDILIHQSPSTLRRFEEMNGIPYREGVGSVM